MWNITIKNVAANKVRLALTALAIVLGVGSSGTVTGISTYLKANAPDVDLVLADPVGSILTDYINKGELGERGSWLVEDDDLGPERSGSGHGDALALSAGKCFDRLVDVLDRHQPEV